MHNFVGGSLNEHTRQGHPPDALRPAVCEKGCATAVDEARGAGVEVAYTKGVARG